MRFSMFSGLAKASFALGMFGCVVSMGSSTALAEQACVRTDAGAKVCGELLPAEGKSVAQRQEENEFVLELQGCKRSSDIVKCSLLIENVASNDRKLWLHGGYGPPTRMISTSGEEFNAKQAQLGQQNSSSYVEVPLIRSVAMQGIVTFEDIPRQIDNLAVLEVRYGFYEPSQTYTSVQFRNVSIEAR